MYLAFGNEKSKMGYSSYTEGDFNYIEEYNGSTSKGHNRNYHIQYKLRGIAPSENRMI